MATGGGLSHSILNASDEVVENPCSICFTKDSKAVESTHFCVDCDGNLCNSCIKYHEKFPATSGHQVVAVYTGSGQGRKAPPLPTERCEEHHGKLLDTYCPTHEELCCASCVNLHHGKCENLLYIPNAAKGIKTSQEYKAVTKSVGEVTRQLKQMRLSHCNVLQKIDMEEKKSQASLQEMRNRLVKHIDDLTTVESIKIKSAFQEISGAVQGEIKAVEEQIETTETCGKRLQEFNDNDSQLFVYVKQGVKNEKEGRSLIKTLRYSGKTKIPKYIVRRNVEKNICDIKSLVELDSPEGLTLDFKASYNVTMQENKYGCYITGLCVLPDGSVVFTDTENKCLTQLDHSYRVKSSMDTVNMPYGVCYTNSDNEVAVTMVDKKKVQFIDVGADMKKTRAFSVDDLCYGICCSNRELFVCCSSNSDEMVCVFTLSGKWLRTLQFDQTKKALFFDACNITASADGSTFHVADQIKGVVAIDRTGKLLSTYTDPELRAYGICTLPDDDLMVTGITTNNVLHVSKDGRKLGVVLGKQNGIEKPIAVCYNFVDNTIILSTKGSSGIYVYDLNICNTSK